MMYDDSIALTGMGVISSIGTSVEDFADSIKASRSGLKLLTRFDPTPINAPNSFEISEFKLEGKKKQELLRINKSAQYAIAAAKEALEQSGYPIQDRPYEVGIVLGSSFLDIGLVTQYLTDVIKSHLTDYRPLQFPNTIPNAMTAHIAIELNAKGPNIALINKLNGGFTALETGIRLLKSNRAQMVLVGGVELLSYEAFLYSQQLGLISGITGPQIHIPFSPKRNGYILGEGCGFLAIEDRQSAKQRGANIFAEIRTAETNFLCPATTFLNNDRPSVDSMFDRLLSKASVPKDEIHGFFSCANSSVDVDDWEDKMIASYFGRDLPVTAFSSFVGEVSDASLLHLIAAYVCLENHFLCPVLGYSGNPDMQSQILQETKHDDKIDNLIISHIGLGGSYSAVLLSRFMSTKVDLEKRAEIAQKLKTMIIDRLEIEDIRPEDVPDDSPIFVEGLELDSLSALDLVVLLEKEFNVKIQDPEEARKIFATINTLAEYVLTEGTANI